MTLCLVRCENCSWVSISCWQALRVFDLWGGILSNKVTVTGQTPGRVTSINDEVKTWAHPQLKPQTKSQQRQWCWASGHMFRGMMLKCLISDWSIRSGREMSVLVCSTGKEEGIRSEMAWNKERGLKVRSFRTIPGTRIPVPRDPWTDLPLISGWDILKAWECNVSNNGTHLLLFSCSNSLKGQYFSFFIYQPLWDTQLFLGSVHCRLESTASVPHSSVSEGDQGCLWHWMNMTGGNSTQLAQVDAFQQHCYLLTTKDTRRAHVEAHLRLFPQT